MNKDLALDLRCLGLFGLGINPLFSVGLWVDIFEIGVQTYLGDISSGRAHDLASDVAKFFK